MKVGEIVGRRENKKQNKINQKRRKSKTKFRIYVKT